LGALLFVIALPVLMITSAIRFATNEEEVYHYSVSTFDVPAETGVSEPELRRASRELIAYFNSSDPAVRIQVEVDGQDEQLFSPREARHLEDVKDLMGITFFAQELALGFVLIYVVGVFIWSAEGSLRSLAAQALMGCALAVAILGVVGILAASGFESSWEGFHEVFFANDLWQLDPDTDRLIQMFPEEFWFRVILFIGALVLLQAAAIAVPALLYLGKARRREERRRRLLLSMQEG
jgi:integral membrane protein (TIGR01906 family)